MKLGRLGKLASVGLAGVLAGALGTWGYLALSRNSSVKNNKQSPIEQKEEANIQIPLPTEFEAVRDYFEKYQDPDIKRVLESLDKGMKFYRRLGKNEKGGWNTPGGYAWAYSSDLQRRIGRQDFPIRDPLLSELNEPGTPTIGQAFLVAFEATGNKEYLEAATESGEALVMAQLKSGGWGNLTWDKTERERKDRYDECLALKKQYDAGKKVKYNPNFDMPARMSRAIFKERVTQAPINFLIQLSKITKNSKFEKSARKGLDFLIESQLPMGAWPMSFPLEEFEGCKDERLIPNRCSFNDGGTASCIETLIYGWEAYADKKYLETAIRGCNFIVKAQNPTGGISQHYKYNLEPAWGRGDPHRIVGGIGSSVEPPGNDSGVTADAITVLSRLYLITGDKKYLDSAKKASDWLKKVGENAGGRYTEYYDVHTDEPITAIKGPKKIEIVKGLANVGIMGFYKYEGRIYKDASFFLNPEGYATNSMYKHVWHAIQLADWLSSTSRGEAIRKINNPSKSQIDYRIDFLKSDVEKIISAQEIDGRWGKPADISEWTVTVYVKGYDFSDIGFRKEGINSGRFDKNIRILSDYLRCNYLTKNQ